jgi:hypothetical protein
MENKRLNLENLTKIVKHRILGDGELIPEHKINRIIKKYLREREEFLEDDEPIVDAYSFTSETQKAFDDMSNGLSEMIGDLEVIKEKEGNVLIETDFYSDEYLSEMISSLETIKRELEHIKSLEGEQDGQDMLQ